MTKITLILSLVLLAAACGPQLTSKEKEDQQAKAYYEDDIKTLNPFLGSYFGKAYMKRTQKNREGSITITPFISSAVKNKAVVQASLSLYENYAENQIPFYDATYFSSEAVNGTLYLVSGGGTAGGTGGANGSSATLTISDDGNKIHMDTVLFTLDAKRIKEKRKK